MSSNVQWLEKLWLSLVIDFNGSFAKCADFIQISQFCQPVDSPTCIQWLCWVTTLKMFFNLWQHWMLQPVWLKSCTCSCAFLGFLAFCHHAWFQQFSSWANILCLNITQQITFDNKIDIMWRPLWFCVSKWPRNKACLFSFLPTALLFHGLTDRMHCAKSYRPFELFVNENYKL